MMPRTPSNFPRLRGLLSLAVLCAVPGALAAQTPAPPATPAAAAIDSINSRADVGRYRGAENAPITIFEFSDFQCPFCRQFERETFAAVDSAFLATGRARLIYFNLPLPNHLNSWVAAEAAMCSAAQGKFWPMHERLFAGQDAWSAAAAPATIFEGYAREAGVDLPAFRACTAADKVARILTQDLTFALGHGVGSTPTFVLIREPAAGEDPQKAQRVLSGAAPFANFAKAMGELEGGK
jgi:protein-disulfide isomerase